MGFDFLLFSVRFITEMRVSFLCSIIALSLSPVSAKDGGDVEIWYDASGKLVKITRAEIPKKNSWASQREHPVRSYHGQSPTHRIQRYLSNYGYPVYYSNPSWPSSLIYYRYPGPYFRPAYYRAYRFDLIYRKKGWSVSLQF